MVTGCHPNGISEYLKLNIQSWFLSNLSNKKYKYNIKILRTRKSNINFFIVFSSVLQLQHTYAACLFVISWFLAELLLFSGGFLSTFWFLKISSYFVALPYSHGHALQRFFKVLNINHISTLQLLFAFSHFRRIFFFFFCINNYFFEVSENNSKGNICVCYGMT